MVLLRTVAGVIRGVSIKIETRGVKLYIGAPACTIIKPRRLTRHARITAFFPPETLYNAVCCYRLYAHQPRSLPGRERISVYVSFSTFIHSSCRLIRVFLFPWGSRDRRTFLRQVKSKGRGGYRVSTGELGPSSVARFVRTSTRNDENAFSLSTLRDTDLTVVSLTKILDSWRGAEERWK